jgi:hypothetical protein
MTSYVVKAEGFELHQIMEAPNIQIDGLSQVMVGSPMIKLVFHQLVAPSLAQGQLETRKACLILTIPMGEAVNIAESIIGNIKEAEDELDNLQAHQSRRLKNMLKRIEIKSI